MKKNKPLAYEKNPLAGDNEPLPHGNETLKEKFVFGLALVVGGAFMVMVVQGLWESFGSLVQYVSGLI